VDFVAEVRRAARAIAAYPEVGRRFSRRLRRTLVRRFPYGLLYRVEANTILVVAVMHLRRRPGYWRGRV
jgi:plasmid stabilization system protein ParE